MKEFLSRFSALKAWFKPPRHLRATRFGVYVILITFGIGLGAMNTGNNLVYMVFGMMLGFITASGVISEMSLRRLKVEWTLPSQAHAQSPLLLRVTLKNEKAKIPSLGVEIEAKIASGDGAGAETIRGKFLHVAAQRSLSLHIPYIPPRRGRFWIREIKIETRFPFGFFRKYMLREADESFIVLPKMDFSKPLEIPKTRAEKNRTIQQRGWGDTFWQIRDFVQGDSPRLISWKISAKQARLMVKETELELDKRVTLAMEPKAAWAELSREDLEKAVSFAASLAWKKFRERYAVGFFSEGFTVQPTTNRKNLRPILEFLALFEPEKSPEKPSHPVAFPPDTQFILSLWKMNSSIL